MTGYEEILTDPSYAGQIVTFTFPHIGNVGVNEEDIETVNLAAASGVRGCVLKTRRSPIPPIGAPTRPFDRWLQARGIVGIAGVDTRALTARIRDSGMPNGVIAHAPDGKFDVDALRARGGGAPGMEGLDLVPGVTTRSALRLDGDAVDAAARATAQQADAELPRRRDRLRHQAQHPAPARRAGLPRHGAAGDGDRRGGARAEARRRVPVERPGRSGGDGRIRGPDDPGG